MREKTENGMNANLEQFLEDIKTVVRDGQELLKAGVSSMKEQAWAGAQTTDRFARERPYQTMGIVFGLGLLAGLLISGAFGRAPEEEEED